MNLLKQIEKAVFVFFFFAIVIISCRQPVKNDSGATSENSPEEFTESPCRGNFTYETFHAVLEQLNLSCSEVYLPYVSEQVLPANKSLTIWIIPKIVYFEPEVFVLDSYILLADTKTGKIVSRNFKPEAWTSDANMLQHPHIDTLDFRLNDEGVMFGVRWGYMGSSRVVPSGENYLELFVQQADSLVSVFEYMTDRHYGENDGGNNGNGWLETYTTELLTTEHKEDGFSDLVLVTEYRMEVEENHRLVKDSISNDSICFFRYIEDVYQKVDKMDGMICREIKGGYGKRECRYLGKTLEEAYYIVYNENEEDFQQYMLPELPPENQEYEMIEKWNEDEDILSISYRYIKPDELTITFCTDSGCGYYIFKQKGNHTVFIYDYHD